MTYLDVSIHTSFPEQISKTYCTYMISKVPSCAFSGFWTLTLKMAYRPLFTSTGQILQNILKTAQDSYTITIKQFVKFQEKMHFEKFQLDQNGRLSAIIHLDRLDIG